MTTEKQVIVVRKDLAMRRGKEIAQGAHASMAAILNLGLFTPTPTDAGATFTLKLPANSPLHRWLLGRFTKICVSVNSEAELIALHEQALAAGLPAALIQDSGLTEFHGVPTYTTVAIGPAESAQIDVITGHLPLR